VTLHDVGALNSKKVRSVHEIGHSNHRVLPRRARKCLGHVIQAQ
jgi:hypothetical protein